jgi:N-acetyl sugar amidotransferase
MKDLRILFVSSGTRDEGIGSLIMDQGESIKAQGIGIEYFTIKSKGFSGYLRNIFKLKNHLKKNQYDIIHAHYGLSGIVAILANNKHNKLVISFMGTDLLGIVAPDGKITIMGKLLVILIHKFVKYADYVIVKSQAMADKIAFKNKSVIPNGIDLKLFSPIERSFALKKLGWDQRFHHLLFMSDPERPEKNYILLESALAQLKSDDIQLHLLKNIPHGEVVYYYNASEVCLLCSYHEGSPNVIKEAMACNCPIISTNVGDVRKVFGNTKGCYISSFDPKDVAEKIRMALDFANNDGHTCGNERILELGLGSEIIAKKLTEVYGKVLNKNLVGSISGIVGKVCKKGLWNESVPGIRFDENGVSNYADLFDRLVNEFPHGKEGNKLWENFVTKIKHEGKGKKYNCILGVSGGTDSSYLMHLSIKYGLRPLAVNLDNGWSSDISVKNIKKITTALNIDLETYVIDYEEVKDVLRSQMIANLPWIDAPTDYAIMSILYKIANRERVKYILTGNDFRSEGKQPTEWTYTDKKQILKVHKLFGKLKLKTYPLISFPALLYLGYFRQIKTIAPFNYLNYQKKEAQKLLEDLYGWEYYGGHHHENIFTKFTIAYWLPEKFGIDKRLITLSAQIMSGEISREDAMKIMKNSSYDSAKINEDKEYVIKKLGFSEDEFRKIWNSPNKSFQDYPSNYPMIKRFLKLVIPVVGLVLPQKPKIFFEMEIRS